MPKVGVRRLVEIPLIPLVMHVLHFPPRDAIPRENQYSGIPAPAATKMAIVLALDEIAAASGQARGLATTHWLLFSQ